MGVPIDLEWVGAFIAGVFLLYHLDHWRDLQKMQKAGALFVRYWAIIYAWVAILFISIGVLFMAYQGAVWIAQLIKNIIWLLPALVFTMVYFARSMLHLSFRRGRKEWLIALAVTSAIYGVPLVFSSQDPQISWWLPVISGWAICHSNIFLINYFEIASDLKFGFYNGMLQMDQPQLFIKRLTFWMLMICVFNYLLAYLFHIPQMSICFVIIAFHLWMVFKFESRLKSQWLYRLAVDGSFLWFWLRLLE